MNKQDIADFFDRCAPWWDADMVRNEELIAAILNNGGIRSGAAILDVACGTGVLFGDYLKRGAASVTGIDISPEMVRIAREKFPQLEVICGDVEQVTFDRQFDCVMVYNAFPHFPDPQKLIATLAQLVKPGGKLSVAHGMSRQALQAHHAGRAAAVSIDLLHEQELAEMFAPWFDVDVIISTDQMYQVAGVRKQPGEPKLRPHSHGTRYHSHAHSGSHSHGELDEDPAEQPDEQLAEMLALMKYMVSHNDAHAQELAELASRLKEAGKEKAYRQLMDTVADFDSVNARLESIRKQLMQ